jgi:hypothetical protein
MQNRVRWVDGFWFFFLLAVPPRNGPLAVDFDFASLGGLDRRTAGQEFLRDKDYYWCSRIAAASFAPRRGEQQARSYAADQQLADRVEKPHKRGRSSRVALS